MKTFDEAFIEVANKHTKTYQDMISSNVERMSNKLWISIIAVQAHDIISKDVIEANTYNEAMVYLCARLHTIFELGLLTGIEMEKPIEP